MNAYDQTRSHAGANNHTAKERMAVIGEPFNRRSRALHEL
jgi:hypothetical protein